MHLVGSCFFSTASSSTSTVHVYRPTSSTFSSFPVGSSFTSNLPTSATYDQCTTTWPSACWVLDLDRLLRQPHRCTTPGVPVCPHGHRPCWTGPSTTTSTRVVLSSCVSLCLRFWPPQSRVRRPPPPPPPLSFSLDTLSSVSASSWTLSSPSVLS
jgi:hypothetical protein